MAAHEICGDLTAQRKAEQQAGKKRKHAGAADRIKRFYHCIEIFCDIMEITGCDQDVR